MRSAVFIVAVIALVVGAPLIAQEQKPVPKGSVRVSIPGCTKGYIFTAGRRTADEPGSVDIPQGTHFRMNGPKKMMAEIKAHEGSMISLTGLMKRGQFNPNGVGIGGGVTMTPGSDPAGGGRPGTPIANQIFFDVEGWRPIEGNCPSR
jgi:hypothetical protein